MQVLRCIPSLFFALLCGFFLSITPAEAQMTIDASSASIVAEPEYPSPLGEVTLSLDAYTLNTTGADIRWYINNTERVDARNERSLTMTAGKLGENSVVSVKITMPNAFPITVSRTIRPSEIDIVIEADTYVPAFYKGRALPSSESKVRVIAIPHTSPTVPLTSLTFEWKQGETVLFGGPVKGKYAADITMSRYEGDYLSVRVIDAGGRSVGGKSISLTPSDPELHFYEENPLRGLSNKAIRGSLTLLGDETTIHAEPFYMSTDLSRKSATFDWQVGGSSVSPDSNDQHIITLRRTGAGGSAEIGVDVITTTTIPQYVQKVFSILF
jgi:hypothetical protein